MRTFSAPFLPSFRELLDLEELDRDLYRGVNEVPANDNNRIYGGQVAAQALKAAALTVASDRFAHSLHCYYLRAGLRTRPVIYQVDRDRDGNSFSSRRVSAVQDGEVIFELVASFHQHRESKPMIPPPPDMTFDPDRCTSERYVHNVPSADARPIPPLHTDSYGNETSARQWVRMLEQLGDDDLLHTCAVVYLSDIGSGFSELAEAGYFTGGASIDHAMWLRDPVRADEWLMLALEPVMAGGSRGLYRGTIHDRGGRLAAVLMQELVLVDPTRHRRI